MTFSENLKFFMKNKKITALNIAKILNVTRGTVTHWSNGVRSPNPEQIEQLALILGITEQDLFPNAQQQKQKIINEELKDPSQETKKQIQKHCNSNNFLGDNNFVGNSEVTQNNNYKETLTAKEQLLLEFFREARPGLQKEMFNYITSK